jgi:hypothetical protein
MIEDSQTGAASQTPEATLPWDNNEVVVVNPLSGRFFCCTVHL